MRKVILAAMLVLVFLVSVLPGAAAYAAAGAEVTLTVQQTFANHGPSAPPSDVFTYRLIPQTSNAPMPVGSNSEDHTFIIAGTRTGQIGPITFTAAGVYTYELRCVTADQPGYTIDRRVYTIEVHITENLEALLIYINGDNKVTELTFAHSYRTPESPPGPPSPPPGTPSPQPDGPKGEDSPKTSDDSNPTLWMTLIAVSSGSLLLLVWIAWRSRDRRR
ncbi:MAG: hypothetical protein FWD84_07425 [Oscillospiraceae bacterium]|nr:hypothetical protein [Oscillospiraceae bacterium]